ncbi:flagella basal body P-ring formation protein FlgA [Rhodothermus marinus]|uniref:flagella basal body P-ring formation protein FlgA n=1 Tax=Rhodothermus marinus TaxID=29549 RepID=UPI000A98C1DF|nr:flagella basal body P-ring formation protein FlgA [Rhodothermus marinus]
MRFVAAGQVLRADDLRPPYAVQTGETVWMHYRRDGILLRLRCQARAAGFVGDEIELYAPQTRATYRGRIVAPGLVEWIATLQPYEPH